MILPLGKLLETRTSEMSPPPSAADPSCESGTRGSTYEFQMLPYNAMDPVPPKSLWFQLMRIVYFGSFLVKSIPVWARLIVAWLLPPPPKSIAGWTALVTGGANGIGRTVALELAKYGCNVVIADLDLVNGEKTARQLRKYRVKAAAYQVDVSVYEQIVDLECKIRKEFGHVDILVNNAGVLPFLVPDEYAPENIKRMMNVNILSHFWTVKVFLPGMYSRRRGHIVGLSSRTAYIPTGYMRNYATTKYAVRGFMEDLHDEIYRDGHEEDVVTTTVFPVVISTRKGAIEHLLSMPNYEQMEVPTPEEAGRTIVEGIRNNQRKLFVPNKWQTWQLALFEDLPREITRLLYRELLRP